MCFNRITRKPDVIPSYTEALGRVFRLVAADRAIIRVRTGPVAVGWSTHRSIQKRPGNVRGHGNDTESIAIVPMCLNPPVTRA